MKIVKRCAALVVFLTILFTVAWLLRATWLPGIARWLDVGEVPHKVDYVMSLPGDENFRPFLAAAMINVKLADRGLIVTNAPSPEELDGVRISTSEIIRRVYQHCNVPASKLVKLSGESSSTAGDIGALAEFLEQRPDATVAVVTSDFHTRRTRWTIRRQLGSAADRMIIVSAPHGDFDVDHWWQFEEGFLLITTEYIKLAAYAVLYGRAIWWLAAASGILVVWFFRRRIALLFRSRKTSADSPV